MIWGNRNRLTPLFERYSLSPRGAAGEERRGRKYNERRERDTNGRGNKEGVKRKGQGEKPGPRDGQKEEEEEDSRAPPPRIQAARRKVDLESNNGSGEVDHNPFVERGRGEPVKPKGRRRGNRRR